MLGISWNHWLHNIAVSYRPTRTIVQNDFQKYSFSFDFIYWVPLANAWDLRDDAIHLLVCLFVFPYDRLSVCRVTQKRDFLKN